MKTTTAFLAACALALGLAAAASAQDKTLRLLTWADYVPAEVKAQFEKESGYKVEVTLSHNEEMVSRLRAAAAATPGASARDDTGFDLAQPALDRIAGAQRDFKLYKPLDMSRIRAEQFIPELLDAAKKNATHQNQLYGLPHVWGTDGLVVNTRLAKIADYPDLCKPAYKGKTAVRLKRSTLLAFAFASGKDPFQLYADPKGYARLMADVGKALAACRASPKFFWDNRGQLLNSLRYEELVGAMMWDTGGWKLQGERAELQYIAPKSGALGWIDSFAIPARGRNDDAAYAWINFNMRPEIAAKVTASAGNLTASRGAEQHMDAALRAAVAASLPPAALANVKWYPPMPAGLDEIEGRVLERIRAAN